VQGSSCSSCCSRQPIGISIPTIPAAIITDRQAVSYRGTGTWPGAVQLRGNTVRIHYDHLLRREQAHGGLDIIPSTSTVANKSEKLFIMLRFWCEEPSAVGALPAGSSRGA
jgi:hypothetical protein